MSRRTRSATSSYSGRWAIGRVISARSDPEICGPDLGVRRELAARSLEPDVPGLDHRPALRDLERLVQVLLDEENGDARAVELRDRAHHLLDEERRQAEARLVEHEQRGLPHDRPPDGAHLLLAAGEAACELPAPLREAGERREDLLEVPRGVLADAWGVGAEVEVLADGELRPELPPLRHERDAELGAGGGGHADERAAAVANVAFARRPDARDGAEGGRLPGTVRAEERHDLSLAHLEGEAVEDLDVAVEDVDAVHAEERLRHVRPPPAFAASSATGVERSWRRSFLPVRLAEVRLHDERVGHDLGWRPLRDLLPVVEDRDAVGERHHRRHHVLDHDHRDLPLVADAADQGGELHRLGGVHPGDDLVEHEHPRRRGEGARELEPLPSRERQRRGRIAGPLGEADELEDLGGAREEPWIAPTATFSATVRFGKGRTIWWVRTIPARTT